MKPIPDKLYRAFVRVHDTDFEDEKKHRRYQKLANEYLGEEKARDKIEQGRLVVDLTRMLIELKGDWVKEDDE
jgi:hypothetical protein